MVELGSIEAAVIVVESTVEEAVVELDPDLASVVDVDSREEVL